MSGVQVPLQLKFRYISLTQWLECWPSKLKVIGSTPIGYGGYMVSEGKKKDTYRIKF